MCTNWWPKQHCLAMAELPCSFKVEKDCITRMSFRRRSLLSLMDHVAFCGMALLFVEDDIAVCKEYIGVCCWAEKWGYIAHAYAFSQLVAPNKGLLSFESCRLSWLLTRKLLCSSLSESTALLHLVLWGECNCALFDCWNDVAEDELRKDGRRMTSLKQLYSGT